MLSSVNRIAARCLKQRQSTIFRHFSSNEGSEKKMPFLHHGDRPRFRTKKFKSPRKRASKLFDVLNQETIARSKEVNPAVWKEPFRVGDAVELKMVVQGGSHSTLEGESVQET